MKSKAEQAIERISEIRYPLILQGCCIGVLTGIVVSFFRRILIATESLRDSVLREAAGGAAESAGTSGVPGMQSPGTAMMQHPRMAVLLLIVLAGCFLGTWLCVRLVPLCAGSGIPQVAGELKGRVFQPWWKVIPAKIIGGTLAIGAGLSLGREGPSIQLGAMVGKGFSSLIDRLATEEKLLMTCGAAAGLSCAFSAPLAGAVFALEGLHKNFSTDVLLGSMAASIAADFVAFYVFGLTPVFDLSIRQALPLSLYWTLAVLGVLLGFFGMIYGKCIAFTQDLYDLIPSKAGRLAVPFLLLIPLGLWYPMAMGGGYRLVTQVADENFVLSALALLLVMKFCYSIVSFSAGAPGGIFMPLLVIGGVAGGLYFTAVTQILDIPGYYIDNFVIYGMVGYFAGIVRSPVTGVILITEMVGDFTNFLALSVVALIAYITADLLGSVPIYQQLLERMLRKDPDCGMTDQLRRNKVLLESDVYISSIMDGRRLKEMKLPRGCLVVSVLRGPEELVPGGDTELKGGDRLTVLCNQGRMDEADRILKKMCRTERIR